MSTNFAFMSFVLFNYSKMVSYENYNIFEKRRKKPKWMKKSRRKKIYWNLSIEILSYIFSWVFGVSSHLAQRRTVLTDVIHCLELDNFDVLWQVIRGHLECNCILNTRWAYFHILGLSNYSYIRKNDQVSFLFNFFYLYQYCALLFVTFTFTKWVRSKFYSIQFTLFWTTKKDFVK